GGQSLERHLCVETAPRVVKLQRRPCGDEQADATRRGETGIQETLESRIRHSTIRVEQFFEVVEQNHVGPSIEDGQQSFDLVLDGEAAALRLEELFLVGFFKEVRAVLKELLQGDALGARAQIHDAVKRNGSARQRRSILFEISQDLA